MSKRMWKTIKAKAGKVKMAETERMK